MGGYVGAKVKPCIFVKLNAIWDWVPSPYVCSEDPDCPESLSTHLASTAAQDAGDNNVWIDCNGRYAADKEALKDRITYFPASRAIPIKYFPYQGKVKNKETGKIEKAYHSPPVAIQVDPKELGQLVHIECRAYYDGVKHVTKTKEGLVQFEVQIKTDY